MPNTDEVTQDVFEATMDGNFADPVDPEAEEADEVSGEEDSGKEAGQDSKTGEEAPPPGEKSEPDVVELQRQLAEVQRESRGRLTAVKSLRQEYQDLKSKLEMVTDIVAKARQGQGQGSPEEKETAEATISGIPVSFTDDGDPYISPKDLEKFRESLATQAKPDATITNKLDELENMTRQTELKNRVRAEVDSVLAKDEGYRPAWSLLENAYNEINAELEKIVLERDIDVEKLTPTLAFDLLETQTVFMKNFNTKYPGIDPELAFEAMTLTPRGSVNHRKLTKALNALKSTPKETDATSEQGGKKGGAGFGPSLKALVKKPSSPASATNQKASPGISLDDITSMKLQDFERLPEDAIRTIERLLEREELEA